MKPPRPDRLLLFDRRLQHRLKVPAEALAGLDEAGRGPLAGPVVAAAVILPFIPLAVVIDDSKRLTPQAREAAFQVILPLAAVGVGIVDVEEIDRIGIHRATGLAMLKALRRLPRLPQWALVDGPWIPEGCPVGATPIVGGDAKSRLIASASIVAKVLRDRLMRNLHRLIPEYGFYRHKGYPTPEHLKALKRLGPCFLHRFSFSPLRPAPPPGRRQTVQFVTPLDGACAKGTEPNEV